MPAIIGIRINPVFTAVTPWTPWRKKGKNCIAPNMAAPSTIVARIETVYTRLRKSPRERMGSSARRVCTRNSTKRAAPAPSEATTGASPQPYWLPPQERPSRSAVAMPTISTAPSQSMTVLP